MDVSIHEGNTRNIEECEIVDLNSEPLAKSENSSGSCHLTEE